MRRLRGIQRSDFRQVAEEEYDVDLAIRVTTIVLSCVVTSHWRHLRFRNTPIGHMSAVHCCDTQSLNQKESWFEQIVEHLIWTQPVDLLLVWVKQI